ncbi:urease accessory protein [Ochrobactrum daejeonense]|uniref:Urease accessory protein UreF n=1 Tax=Brucella daejeonensis TaxID=659015 RepID=A0A7W9AYA2_9HYPH|nr:urease accessory protein [Brucella daejeonensis]
MTTITTTTDASTALLRLMAWLSPVFPVGSFSYSHGLERAVHDGFVTDADTLRDWLRWLVTRGSGWNDAVLCAQGWRQAVTDDGDLTEVAELAEALAGSRERHMETMLQGAAFLAAARSWPAAVFERLPAETPYPVAVGAVAGAHGVPLASTLAAFLQAFSINLLQASIRLSVTGQNGVTATMAALEQAIARTAARAETTTLDDLGSATYVADMMAMKHETQHSRLFRT